MSDAHNSTKPVGRRCCLDVRSLAQLLHVMMLVVGLMYLSLSKVLDTVPRFPIAVKCSGSANEGRRKM